MTAVKISAWNNEYANTNNFSFTDNPNVLPIGDTKKAFTDVPLQSISPFLNFESVTPTVITITGSFRGVTRDTLMQQFAQKLRVKNMKKDRKSVVFG